MRKYILLAAACLMSVAGCATTADLNDVRRDFRYLNEKVESPSENVRLLKEENSRIRSSIKKNEEVLSAVRTRQAETGADITGLRADIQQLTGKIEAFANEFDAVKISANSRDEEIKALTGKLDAALASADSRDQEIKALKKKLDAVAAQIDDAGKREESPEIVEMWTRQAPRENGKGKVDKKTAYEAAYNEFKAGRYEKARTDFQDFLRQYPKTEYSDNAQFRIGECYYFEKNYEKAVLEYDKVLKNYPHGDRVLSALLKQGLSFLKLGDKTSARTRLQQVMRDYPDTNQARIARETLLGIK